jgi:catechol 2,3-dioxygenase-like lactoylglutathione lyase family enzyme
LQGKVQGDRPVVTLLRQSAGPVSASTAEAHSAPLSRERIVDTSLPRGIDHIGVTVPDVNAASAFLEKAFGARAVYDVLPEGGTPMAGRETEKELGMPPGAKIVHMRLMQIGTGPTLELFQIEGAPQQQPAQLNDFGWTHIAVYVDDIHAAAQRFQEAGGTLLSPPHGLAGIESGAQNAGVYGRAPWGGLIELLTYASGIQYPDPSTTRWTPPPRP